MSLKKLDLRFYQKVERSEILIYKCNATNSNLRSVNATIMHEKLKKEKYSCCRLLVEDKRKSERDLLGRRMGIVSKKDHRATVIAINSFV